MDKILKQFGKERIEAAVINSSSFSEVTRNLGLNSRDLGVRKNVERSIKRLGLSTIHFESLKKYGESKVRYKKERLEELVKTCKNYNEILLELDVLPIISNYRTLKKYLKEYNIETEHLKYQRARIKWTKENLEDLIKSSESISEVLKKMKIRLVADNYINIKKHALLYNIDISHLVKPTKVSNKKIPLEKILTENSTYGRNHLKKRLYNEGLKERKCELCGQDENWNGKKMSLILDHKNGVHNDNRLENLRIVCPNCNATLDTHCGKNTPEKIRKIKEQKKLNIENAFIFKRKVERPPYQQLINEIFDLGYVKVGKKYGVSDNAIRKWIKTYEKYGK